MNFVHTSICLYIHPSIRLYNLPPSTPSSPASKSPSRVLQDIVSFRALPAQSKTIRLFLKPPPLPVAPEVLPAPTEALPFFLDPLRSSKPSLGSINFLLSEALTFTLTFTILCYCPSRGSPNLMQIIVTGRSPLALLGLEGQS